MERRTGKEDLPFSSCHLSPSPAAQWDTVVTPNDQAHVGRTILSGMKPPESRQGHTAQKHCDPDGLVALPDMKDNWRL